MVTGEQVRGPAGKSSNLELVPLPGVKVQEGYMAGFFAASPAQTFATMFGHATMHWWGFCTCRRLGEEAVRASMLVQHDGHRGFTL